ncbi:AraC family transcriptional regulator [Echinimonas agarilytica]|uniref:AraC family transcriptional regulator n=1 Tax=Echinimonas agarilytica TaxID=1215918 RepID=A0AA41W7E6_9GAMM|nr:AraC family transcriptional regulator [Echinimonas agarilytica]MCM2680374.1 AraC family transcriptional regulator [Echinimonas agarilytica]
MHHLASLMQSYVDRNNLHSLNGVSATSIPGVKFYRADKGSPRQPFIYDAGIIIMGQGHKTIHLADHQMSYGPGDFLVLGAPLPLECEAFADNGLPMMGLSIEIDSPLLHRLVNDLQAFTHATGPDKGPLDCCVKSVHLCPPMLDATHRLLQALLHQTDAHMLGESIVSEIIYRVLVSTQGHVLFDLARHDGHYARVTRALHKMHQQYADPITVEVLAEEANMSVSAFHKAFRLVTRESPLQYLKKVRLNKAKELIAAQGKRANDAARLVGYASPSQFSREFKRHFNATPKTLLNQSATA